MYRIALIRTHAATAPTACCKLLPNLVSELFGTEKKKNNNPEYV
jgi:hypothetical protein